MPYIMREPMRMAVTASPGIPRESIVVMAPPITALFAMHDTESPSNEPSPYSSGCLDILFACPQLMMEAMSPPAPGIAPTMTDIIVAIALAGASLPNSLRVRNCLAPFTSATMDVSLASEV